MRLVCRGLSARLVLGAVFVSVLTHAVLISASGIAEAPAANVPTPWISTDIGAPLVAGSATGDGSSFQIEGSGSDIWFNADQFQYVYQPVTGDVTLTARVSAVNGADAWSKAGLMIRASLSADAANAFVFATETSGRGFQRRLTAGDVSDWTPGCWCPPPGWLRLARLGNTFTASQSDDGQTWTVVGTETIEMPATIYVGLAVTAHTVSPVVAGATFDQVDVQTAAGSEAGPAWSGLDIGQPTLPGSFSSAGSQFVLRSAGLDVWGTADQFHFVSQPVTGDMQIVARIRTLKATDLWTKAGIMIRSSLEPGASNVAVLATPVLGWAYQRRLIDNGPSYYSWVGFGAAPGWVKLVRAGDLFTTYRSADGVQWTQAGSDLIPMPSTVYVGLALSSHNAKAYATATFSDVGLVAEARVNRPPSVQLSVPVTATAPASLALSATARDPDGTVARVDFYANGQLVAGDTTSPFGITWTNVPAGVYLLTAVATDNAGATGVSAGLAVTVLAPLIRTSTVAFVPPVDYATNVTSLRVELRLAGDAITAAPRASASLGKPAASNGEVSVDITTLVESLPAGSYYAVVVSTGPGGSTPSAPSPAFTK